MIKFVTGNFFDYKADIRINTVNCVGAMGAGVALQFKKKYPEMNKEYIKACIDKTIQIGKPQVWQSNDFFDIDENVIIINFPTKLHWKNPSKYEYIEKGLLWLQKFLKDYTGKTITIPALGCGHGGLDWNIVKEMIVKFLSDIKMNILVFEPESSLIPVSDDIEEKLIDNHIRKLTPISEKYPLKFKGKSGSEIYIKGNDKLIYKTLFSLFVNSKPDEREKNAVYDLLDEVQVSKPIFLLGFGNSFEIDIVKYLLKKGAKIVIALPYGILNLKIRKDLIEFWDDELITTISISAPDSKWNIPNATKMLKFRLKFSDISLFTHHDITSISKFEKDIKDNNNHKFFINYWTESNNFYNFINAKKISKNKVSKKPNLKLINELID